MSEPQRVSEPLSEILASARHAHDVYKRKKLSVIPAECGDCLIDSPKMGRCLFSGDDDCKHTAVLKSRALAKDRTARMRAGKVPKKFWPEVESIDACEALNAVRRLLAGEQSIAILLGGPGAGKSLCSSLAVAERGGLFAPASGLAGSEERVDALQKALVEAPLAVLDDVGRARSATPAAIERTEDLICIRYDSGLPTILTANLIPFRSNESEPPGFWDIFGGAHGRIADRLGGIDSVTICPERSRRRRSER
jgi:hypothetical protein